MYDLLERAGVDDLQGGQPEGANAASMLGSFDGSPVQVLAQVAASAFVYGSIEEKFMIRQWEVALVTAPGAEPRLRIECQRLLIDLTVLDSDRDFARSATVRLVRALVEAVDCRPT